MIKAVIFDLDGTLANTISDLAFAANRTLKKFGFGEHSEEKYKIFVGNGIPELLRRATDNAADQETFDKIKQDFLDYYNVHYCDRTVAYEGTPELVAAVRERGIKTAVVTNKNDDIAKIIVKELFGNVFDIVCGSTGRFPTKPDPSLTLDVMDKLGLEACECVFIGDSCVDMQTAVNSGAFPVGETWGFRGEKELLENGAKYIIHTPDELLSVIDKINELEITDFRGII